MELIIKPIEVGQFTDFPIQKPFSRQYGIARERILMIFKIFKKI